MRLAHQLTASGNQDLFTGNVGCSTVSPRHQPTTILTAQGEMTQKALLLMFSNSTTALEKKPPRTRNPCWQTSAIQACAPCRSCTMQSFAESLQIYTNNPALPCAKSQELTQSSTAVLLPCCCRTCLLLVLPAEVPGMQFWQHCTNTGSGQGDLSFPSCFQISSEDPALQQSYSFAERHGAFIKFSETVQTFLKDKKV